MILEKKKLYPLVINWFGNNLLFNSILRKFRKNIHKATSARMKIRRRPLIAWCDEVCVDYVKAYTYPLSQQFHTRKFLIRGCNEGSCPFPMECYGGCGILTHNGCDDCNHYRKFEKNLNRKEIEIENLMYPRIYSH